MRLVIFVLALIAFVSISSVSSAQDGQAVATGQADGVTRVKKEIKVPHPNDMPSLLFTYWEHTAVKDARRSRDMVRPPTDEELTKDLKDNLDEERIKPPPEERDISLGGIVYVSVEDWTIWLNGKRVTPQALPKEVIGLSVYDEYIEIKWFDEWSNQIFPIRLRPHQRFNIDTRIFLPG